MNPYLFPLSMSIRSIPLVFAVVLAFLSSLAVAQPRIVSLASAWTHTLALADDGTVWAWGNNEWGGLGNDYVRFQHTPEQVPGLSDMVAVGTGALALKNDGTVWIWGPTSEILDDGTDGKRGLGVGGVAPHPVRGLADISAVLMGPRGILALRRDGTVWSVGSDAASAWSCCAAGGPVPLPVQNLSDIVAIASGIDFSVALKRDGSVWGWGLMLSDVLGPNEPYGETPPKRMPGLDDVVQLAAGGQTIAAIKRDGSVWLLTGEFYGVPVQSGSGVAQQVAGISDAISIAVGGAHTLVARSDGTVWGWGDGSDGELGASVNGIVSEPTQVVGIDDVEKVFVGDGSSFAIRRDGTVMAWGEGRSWTLGTVEDIDAIQMRNPVPTAVLDLRNRDVPPGGVLFEELSRGDGEAYFSYRKFWNGGAPAEIQASCISQETGNEVTASGISMPLRVAGMTNGQTYDCNFVGVNAAGTEHPPEYPLAVTPRAARYVTIDSSPWIEVTESAGTVPLIIRRHGDLSGEVTINYSSWGLSTNADLGTDYVHISRTVTFPPGVESLQIGIELPNDDEAELAIMLAVHLQAITPGVEIGPVGQVQILVTDDDELRVDLSTSTSTITEGGQVLATVTRYGNDLRAVVVPWFVIPTSSTLDDIRTQSGSLVLAQGVRQVNFRVTTTDDQALEGDEAFFIALGKFNIERVATSVRAVKVTITDNDSMVRLGPPTVTVDENGTRLVLSVTRVGFLGNTTRVNWSANNGTGVAGTDYGTRGATSLTGTLTMGPNVGTAEIAIPIIDDAVVVGDLTFSVALTSASGSVIDADAKTVAVTIAEDDRGVQLAHVTRQIAEGGGSITLLIDRLGPPTGEISANWTTANGSARAGSQFGTAGSAAQMAGTVVWSAGDASQKSVVIPILDNGTVNADSNFTVTLTSATGAALGVNRRATVTIADDDNTVQFNVATRTVAENAGNLLLTVTRIGGAAAQAAVQWRTVDGTAIAGTDYGTAGNAAMLGGTLDWAANDKANKTITIPIINNTTVAGGERSFAIELHAPAGATMGSVATTVVSITEDDKGVALASASHEVLEGAASVISLVVNRMGNASQALSVPWSTANGTALAGTQFGTQGNPAQRSGTVSWLAGDATPKTIVVPILNNAISHGDTQFTVALGNVPSGFIKGEPNVATISIRDDDLPSESQVEFAVGKTLVVEGPGASAALVLNRSVFPACAPCNLSRAVSVKFSTVAGTALAGSDYVAATNAVVTFAPFESSKTVRIALTNDGVAEAPESFRVKLLSPSPSLVLGAAAETTVAIQDDDEQFPPHGVWPPGWTVPTPGGMGTEAGWHVSFDAGAIEGFASLRSDTIFDDERAILETPLQTYLAGTVQFRFRVSSEADFDRLRFYLCNAGDECTQYGEWSGQANETTWGTATISVPPGVHKFRWTYEKDSAVGVGLDSAWIDAVTLPAVQ